MIRSSVPHECRQFERSTIHAWSLCLRHLCVIAWSKGDPCGLHFCRMGALLPNGAQWAPFGPIRPSPAPPARAPRAQPQPSPVQPSPASPAQPNKKQPPPHTRPPYQPCVSRRKYRHPGHLGPLSAIDSFVVCGTRAVSFGLIS